MNVLINAVNKFKSFVPDCSFNYNYCEYDFDSWFNANFYDIKASKNKFKFIDSTHDCSDQLYKAKPIILLPNHEQKNVLNDWIEANRQMYNTTVKLFRSNIFLKKKKTFNFKYVRTYLLKQKRDIIRKKFNCPTHILDATIKRVCAMYKSSISNIKANNIKHFNVRYLKKKKNTNVAIIEKGYFFNSGFCKTFLGDIMKNKSNFDYKDIISDCTLHYNKMKDVFTLYIPEKIDYGKEINDNNYIAIDPGYRTFLTCLTNDKIVELGTNVKNLIKYFKNEHPNKEVQKKRNIRVQNKVEDLHWKCIDYLTTNYSTIVIGKLSTKNCASRDSFVSREMRLLGLRLQHYKFLQRLEYKCKERGVKLIIMNESYTTKICSYCGHYNDIGSSKIYHCRNCNKILDRDQNSSRNILMKGIKNIS